MAKKTKDGKIVSALKKAFSIGQNTQVPDDVTDRDYRSVSEDELKSIMKSIYVTEPVGRPPIDKVQIPAMLEPIGRELIDRRMDHEKLMSLAPEIEQAASILIPSILSPNDFRKNIFEVIIKGGNEEESVKTKIIELIHSHFDGELEMSSKLSLWVADAMFKMGAKAVMIMPTSVVGNLRDSIGTTESLESVTKSLLASIEASTESFHDIKPNKRSLSDDDITDKVISTSYYTEMINAGKDINAEIRKAKEVVKKGLGNAAKHIKEKNLITFSDDPTLIFKPKISHSAAIESINSKILKKLGADPKPFHRDTKDGIANPKNLKNTTYSSHPYIDLSEYIVDDNSEAFPAVIELPYESVIPIIVEGAPGNHIGYFVMLNENGVPISAESDNFGEMLSSATGTQRVNNIYNAFYGASQFSIQMKMATDAKVEILNSIYDSFINNMMKAKLDKLGLDKHRVELSSSLSRVMLARLFKNAQTRILFIPKKLMMYLTFQHNADGTGRSKIDNIKFPLSLKMTLIITRLISLIESSINRRKLEITLDDGIGNPTELLRSIKKDVMQNKVYGISYDPSTIIKSILDKELTIVPTNIPGVDNFTLTDSLNNVEYPRPDDQILQEITNMYMLSLGVPPSAMNRLSEDEFSRSVASNNIFFSNQLKVYQRDVVAFMTMFITTYIHFSKKLRESIRNILEKETGLSAGVKPKIEGTLSELDVALEAKTSDKITDGAIIDSGNDDVASDEVKDVRQTKTEKIDKKAEAKKKKEEEDKKAEDKKKKGERKDGKSDLSLEERMTNILANIRFSLPSPMLAQDKASFDELKDYIEIIDNVLVNILPDEMSADTDVQNTIKIIRSGIKRTILQAHIKSNSMLSDIDFDVLKNINLAETVETTQKILNIKAALTQLTKAVTPNEGEEGMDNGMGGTDTTSMDTTGTDTSGDNTDTTDTGGGNQW